MLPRRGNFIRASTLIVGVVVLGIQPACAEPSEYLCTPTHSVGLHYDESSRVWTGRAFTPSERYVLRKLTKEDWAGKYGTTYLNQNNKPTWVFYQVGDHFPEATCYISSFIMDEGDFECDQLLDQLSFDKNSGRFQLYYNGGYMEQPFWETQPADKRPKDTDDAFIEIGVCEGL